jgi:hypothetical protein
MPRQRATAVASAERLVTRRWFLVVCLALLACSNAPTLRAQTTSATLSGTIMDPTGRVVPGVQVSATNIDTGISANTKTNADGIYVLTALQPGHYRVIVTKQGFKQIALTAVVLNVQDTVSRNFSLEIGAVSETVTVMADSRNINTTDGSVSTVVDRQFAENLPLNGRSFQTLIELTPGVVLTNSSYASDGQFSINGQRADSNYWMVDGVSANIGMSSIASASDTLSGSLGGFSAQGGTNSLVSVDAMQEFRIQTSTFAPEFGRTPGGQISIVTRSGTNQFHGSVFDYLGNDVLNANDWFSDHLGLPKAEEQQNDFGGTLSGPLRKNKTFFFFSYEGLRLLLPQSAATTVPDLSARQSPNAAPAVQPFLNAYPLPNGPELLNSSGNPTGAAGFTAGYSNRSTLDAASLRIDHKVNDKVALFGRYNYAPSELVARPGPEAGYALSVLSTNRVGTQTATAGLTWTATSTLTNDLRVNYSRVTSDQIYSLDNFGGAKPFDSSAVGLPSGYTSQNSQALFGIYAASWTGLLEAGASADSLQRQFNLVDSLSWQKGPHNLKFGADYRHLAPRLAPPSYSQQDYFFSLADAQDGSVDEAVIQGQTPVPLIFRNMSWFAQDTWRASPRLTFTYGLRWDVDFAPKTSSGPSLPTVVNFNNPSTLALAPAGTPVFDTRYGNVAPRVGLAYQIAQRSGWESVVRGGWGIFYDLATSQFQAAPEFYPFGSEAVLGEAITGLATPFPLDPGPGGTGAPAPVSSQNQAVIAYDPKIRSPYTQEWNLTFEQSLGPAQSLSASYVGAIGRRLLVGESFQFPNANITEANLTGNYGTSDYDALQVQFQRRLSHGLQALASFSWAHSIDTGSTGAGGITFADYYSREEGAQANRGPSSFDIRDAGSVALTYDIPSPRINALAHALFRDWSVQSVFQARSAPPVDVNYDYLYTLETQTVGVRPNVTPGIPLYLYGSQCTAANGGVPCPGGKAINFIPGAVVGGCPDGSQSIGPFCPPAANMQGDLGRNALRGFGAWQWDFAVHREFPIGERLKLQFRAELFNVLNHPNFGQPSGNLAVPELFGLSQQTLAQDLNSFNLGSGGFDPAYQLGGPRSIQFALKMIF